MVTYTALEGVRREEPLVLYLLQLTAVNLGTWNGWVGAAHLTPAARSGKAYEMVETATYPMTQHSALWIDYLEDGNRQRFRGAIVVSLSATYVRINCHLRMPQSMN